MSRLNKNSDLSDSDSEDFEALNNKKTNSDNKPTSNFSRPTSATGSRNKSSKTLSDDSDEEDTANKSLTKSPLKSGSSTSIASKIKNSFKNTFMSKSKKSKSSKKNNRSDDEEDTTESRSRSIERSIQNVIKSHSKSKMEQFSRPETALDNSITSSSDNKSLDTDRTDNLDLTSKSSDEQETARFVEKKATTKTSVKKTSHKKSRSSSSDSSGSSSNTSSNTSVKGVKMVKKSSKDSKAVSSADSETDTDTEQEQSVPIRVTIEKKPPIDRSKKSSKLDRPKSDSGSETERAVTKGSKHKKSHFLSKTFDVDSENDSERSSGNEMTDVSPLPTPKDNTKASLSMNVFYKALEKDLNSAQLQKSPKRSALKKSQSLENNKGHYNVRVDTSYDDDYAYTSHVNNSLDMDYELNFKINPMTAKMMENNAENKRNYQKIIKPYVSPYSEPRPVRLTSSALNRQREQQRIERENQVII